jgi:hypothetical protein
MSGIKSRINVVYNYRFGCSQQSGSNGVVTKKLTTLVEFPLTDFNISDHLVKTEERRCGSKTESVTSTAACEENGDSATTTKTPNDGKKRDDDDGPGPPREPAEESCNPSEAGGLDFLKKQASKTLNAVSEWPKAILGRSKRRSEVVGSQYPFRTSHPASLRPEECVYNLYAVCNHHGSDAQGGHYSGTVSQAYFALHETLHEVQNF